MVITKKEQQTIEYYKQNSDAWVNKHGLLSEKESFWCKELETFHSYLPSSKILEIGSGEGKEARQLINMEYSYSGIDASEELVRTTQKHLPEGTFFSQNIYNLDFPETSFDGFWCAAVLLHIPPQGIDVALQKIKKSHEAWQHRFYFNSRRPWRKLPRKNRKVVLPLWHRRVFCNPMQKRLSHKKRKTRNKSEPISRYTINWPTFFVLT